MLMVHAAGLLQISLPCKSWRTTNLVINTVFVRTMLLTCSPQITEIKQKQNKKKRWLRRKCEFTSCTSPYVCEAQTAGSRVSQPCFSPSNSLKFLDKMYRIAELSLDHNASQSLCLAVINGLSWILNLKPHVSTYQHGFNLMHTFL